MNRKFSIFLVYLGVAVISAAILFVCHYLQTHEKDHTAEYKAIVNQGKASEPQWFEIGKDLQAVNQDNQQVKLSDLKGKVWVVAQFFAVCPHCAVRNGQELRAIYDEFKGNPDFHIACISVDPDTDKQDRLSDYAKALGADSKNWWFLNAGEAKSTHEYLEKELKFFSVHERTDPADIAANGRYFHDLSFLLVDRNFKVIGKYPLADARSEDMKKLDPGLYDRVKKDLYDRIRAELEKNETPGI